MSGTNGHRIDPPLPGTVTITEAKPKPITPIVDYVRPNGFEEKAAIIQEDEKGYATLRIFGVPGTVLVKGVPQSFSKKRGHWTYQGGGKRGVT